MVPNEESLKPLTQSDRQELEEVAASDKRLLKKILRGCFLILVLVNLLAGVVIPAKTWEEYPIRFLGVAVVPMVILVWIMWPVYRTIVKTKRDLSLGLKRTFVSTIERKTEVKKERWVDLITSNQEAITISLADDEKYRVGDNIYVEQAPASKLPPRVERMIPNA
jgi:CBS domain containing-hemolysin-like protein